MVQTTLCDKDSYGPDHATLWSIDHPLHVVWTIASEDRTRGLHHRERASEDRTRGLHHRESRQDDPLGLCSSTEHRHCLSLGSRSS